MKCPVIVKFIRSDNKTLIVDGTDWILPNDGLDGFGEVSNDLSAVDKSVGDGSVLVSKRVNSIDREIKAVVTDKRLNQTLRYKATSFFNGKFSFKIFVTYMGRTRWCDGEIRKFFCPSENIYDKVYFSVTFFCANPFMKSEEDFGKNIAGVTPMVAFPYLCGLKTGEYKTTKSGKEITISGENTRIDAIQVHGESEQKSYSGKNLLENLVNNQTIGGITLEKRKNGEILLIGKATKDVELIVGKYKIKANTDYIVSGCPKGGSEKTYSFKPVGFGYEFGNGKKIRNSSEFSINFNIVIKSGFICPIEFIWKPMLELGNEVTPYEPYVGGKPSPNPDFPQEIVSKPTKIESNGANGEKSVANILTPLCGIKVASGGNYTDENGQQWITDELVKYEDGSGKYIKRIYTKVFNGTENINLNLNSRGGGYYYTFSDKNIRTENVNKQKFCTRLSYKTPTFLWGNNETGFSVDFDHSFRFRLVELNLDSVVKVKEKLKQWYDNGNPMIFVYELDTPQETPLTSEQLSQFSNLKTYSPHCVISNDGNIPMNLQYVTIVGGKKHIEGRPTGRFDFARKVELHNDGDVEAYCKAIFVAKGEVTNPKLIINGKYVRVITTMHSDDVLVIDFTKDPPTVRLNGKNIIGQTDRTSNFDGMQLNIGDSEIGYDADTGTGLLDVSIYYNKLYGTM